MKLKQRKSLINYARVRRLRRKLGKINRLADQMSRLSNDELQAKTVYFKEKLANGASLDSLMVEAFAVIREADKRVLGLYPYDVQVLGAIALHKGAIAEMKTGEGKTLTATMPLYLNALTGEGAMLVTINSYLAKRDAKEMGEVFEFMGLTVGVGVFKEGSKPSPAMKRAVYKSDIVYTTSSALGFDYLTDNLASGADGKFLRGFNYVIVDEADAVLLDAAQTPLIISGVPRVQSNFYGPAKKFVDTLIEDEDYYFDDDKRLVYLTRRGTQKAERFFDIPDFYAKEYYELNRHINLALRAKHTYKKDRDYVVDGDKVHLLDNTTGRVLEGTRLQSGIHQAIEAKEDAKITKDNRSMASVTYQDFFNMFKKLSGMTGTGWMVEKEMIRVHKVPVISIPTNKPIIRDDFSDKMYMTIPEKLEAVMAEVRAVHATGRPILLFAGNVEYAEIFSRLLLREGFSHNVLTAKNISREALIVQEAGRRGAITVATPVAGRGTDIKLGVGVAELGGLAVIGTDKMMNRRTEWQLRGRSGRQGDPGTSVFYVSLEDDLIVQYASKRIKRYFERHNNDDHRYYGQELKRRKYQTLIRHCQAKSEDKEESRRQQTLNFGTSLTVQRNKIYTLRDQLIFNKDSVVDKTEKIIKDNIDHYIKTHKDLTEEELRHYIYHNYSYQFKDFPKGFDVQNKKAVKRLLWGLYEESKAYKATFLKSDQKLADFYRISVLKAIDTCWIQEVDDLQQLRSYIGFRARGQRNSVVEYNREARILYDQFIKNVHHAIVRNILLSGVEGNEEDGYSIYYV